MSAWNLLPPELAERAVATGLRAGAEFVELYAEHRVNRAVSAEDGAVERATAGIDRGLGIRIVKDGVFRYGFTEDLSEAAVLRLAAEVAPGGGGKRSEPAAVRLDAAAPGTAEVTLEHWAGMAEMAELVSEVDEHARAFDGRVTQVVPLCTDTVQDVVVANSDGRYAADRRVRVRLRARVIVTGADGTKSMGVETVAGSCGYELLKAGSTREIAESAATQALTIAGSQPAPSGEMPVVLHAGSGGVLAHECCGHGLEADLALGLRSVYRDLEGAQVASELITFVDDPTLPGLWGSYVMDDEATPGGPVTLVEAGRLTGFLTDLRTGRTYGRAPTGNGRRVSYRHVPYPRMSNTYIANGPSTREEIFTATPYGLYAKRLGGGSVEPTTGVFTFTVREAYMIRNGRIAEPVHGATLRGESLTALRAIDMVGNDLDFQAASCGKEGQRAWVTVGQPTLRVGSLLVAGGR